MVIYPAVEMAEFIERENRFIAHCRLPNQEELIRVHVKNTGRCRELLVPGVSVAVSYQASQTRKTDYDLIAVKKAETWVNIDSQVPNQLAFEGLKSGALTLTNLQGKIIKLQREVTFGSSRFDLYLETSVGEKVIVEVKGMTLENHGVGAFPDAPSLRALKHLRELATWRKKGYVTYVVFIVQLETVETATIHTEMQPALAEIFAAGLADGLIVQAQTCQVAPNKITLKDSISFVLEQPFKNPNT